MWAHAIIKNEGSLGDSDAEKGGLLSLTYASPPEWDCPPPGEITFVRPIKQTFYLQKVETPKVTLGILFWILNEHCVQIWRGKKLRCIFYLLAFLENTCFVCISMGNGPVGGAITCTLKHKKVYYSKMHPNFFFWFLQKMSGYYSWT